MCDNVMRLRVGIRSTRWISWVVPSTMNDEFAHLGVCGEPSVIPILYTPDPAHSVYRIQTVKQYIRVGDLTERKMPMIGHGRLLASTSYN